MLDSSTCRYSINGNEDADKAAKSAIDMPVYPVNIPIYDYLAALKPAVNKKWQNLWNNEPDTVQY